MEPNEQMLRNQRAWDAQTVPHLESDFYDVASFKAGRNSLRPFEVAALGDVTGRSLLHLMCHFGQDTLSWARLGANVTGVDFSAESIAAATALARELEIDARFVRANVDVQETYAGWMAESQVQTTWPWTVGKLVTALAQAGLRIQRLEELPVDLRQRHPAMVQSDDGLWRLPGDPLPLLLTCQAVKA